MITFFSDRWSRSFHIQNMPTVTLKIWWNVVVLSPLLYIPPSPLRPASKQAKRNFAAQSSPLHGVAQRSRRRSRRRCNLRAAGDRDRARRRFHSEGAPAVRSRPPVPELASLRIALSAGYDVVLQRKDLLAGIVILARRGAAEGHEFHRFAAVGMVENHRRRRQQRQREGGVNGGQLGLRDHRCRSIIGFRFALCL